mgnify:CR=1 FL=1
MYNFYDYFKVFKKKYIDDDSIVPTEVVLLNYQEWEYTSIGVDPTFEELVDYVNKHNSSLTIINGSIEASPLLYDNTNERYKNIKPVIYWPTYFLSTWYYKCKRETNTSHLSEDELIKEYNQEVNFILNQKKWTINPNGIIVLRKISSSFST